jgi:predicted lipoprotein with Yx(FWY)xxD motif
MFRSKHLGPLAAATAGALSAVAITACGSASSSNQTTTGAGAPAAASAPSSTSAPSGTVDLANSSLGPILIDAQGTTLYLWQADTGAKSTCTGACASAWPPLVTTGKPTAGSGVRTSLLGTTKRQNGTEQVTYNGHPLYRFAGDTAARQTNGQGSTGFGALWYVLSPRGNALTGAAPSTGGSSPTGY